MFGWVIDIATSTWRRNARRNSDVTANSGRTILTVTGRFAWVSIASVITVFAPELTTFSMRYRSFRTRPTRVLIPVGVGSGVSRSTAAETLPPEQVGRRAGIMEAVTDSATEPDTVNDDRSPATTDARE